MATPAEKLANSLNVLRTVVSEKGSGIHSSDISRTHRERLVKRGFLQEIVRGWYIPSRPDELTGESTAWYASYWAFCAAYLNHRFGEAWCVSPEQSIALHAHNRTVPPQLLVRAKGGDNKVLPLPHATSLLVTRSNCPDASDLMDLEGLRVYKPVKALIACAPGSFARYATDIQALLMMMTDPSDVLGPLLEGGHARAAGRLAGAFRSIGKDEFAVDIVATMRAADYSVREIDPFENAPRLSGLSRPSSPYVARIRLMWEQMRDDVLRCFPHPPAPSQAPDDYLQRVDDVYVSDAYHSLSIEGYQVTEALIERVRQGRWNPDTDEDDARQRDAMAARGYWQAFQAVKNSVEAILNGTNAGELVRGEHRVWFRELFSPGVTAGLLKPSDLAGYRNGPVYIRGSMHVPPNRDAVRETMPAFFDLLEQESEPAVRVVLGHFFFVYIHPYMDGNGRIGRFLMNAMLASGGYPWTIIPVERRSEYMAALEQASVRQDIRAFTAFLGELVNATERG